jgi:hypothetical protein
MLRLVPVPFAHKHGIDRSAGMQGYPGWTDERTHFPHELDTRNNRGFEDVIGRGAT